MKTKIKNSDSSACIRLLIGVYLRLILSGGGGAVEAAVLAVEFDDWGRFSESAGCLGADNGR